MRNSAFLANLPPHLKRCRYTGLNMSQPVSDTTALAALFDILAKLKQSKTGAIDPAARLARVSATLAELGRYQVDQAPSPSCIARNADERYRDTSSRPRPCASVSADRQ